MVFEAGPSLERPNIIVQVQQEVNDTMLPDFRYSFDPQSSLFEISFNWKGMYSHFFREQRVVKDRIGIAASTFQSPFLD